MNLHNISKKQLIVVGITFLVLIFVLYNVMRNINSNTDSVINYRKDNGQTLIERATISYDRNVYYNCENFINQYINSFSNDSEGYLEYYKNSLTDSYKRKISKFKYKKIAKSFYQKILEYNTVDTSVGERLKSESSLYDSDCLGKIYSLDSNHYLCELNLKDETKGYIGIYFNNDLSKAYIFYIE